MKIRYQKTMRTSVLWLCGLMLFAACKDDHFAMESSVSKTTLWQNIEANGQLSDFKAILEKTKVTKNENDNKSTITYKDLLSSSQTFTVFAPVNGTFDPASWLQLLEEGQNVKVEKEFVRNHLTRYSYAASVPAEEKILMMNAKKSMFNHTQTPYMFKNATLVSIADARFNTPASNGSLYLLNAEANYLPNIYEYLATDDRLSDYSEYVHSQDTTYFLASASTQGATVNGKIQYIDSVLITTNKYTGTLLTNEDSLLLSVYLTNSAFEDAKAIQSSYFTYPSLLKYYGTTYQTRNNATTEKINADSLQNIYVRRNLTNYMYFSLNNQPGFNAKEATVETVHNFVENADSLRLGVANGITVGGGYSIKKPYCQQIFAGAEPIEVSNGFTYVVDNYNYVPSKTFHNDIIYDYYSTALDYGRTRYLTTTGSGASQDWDLTMTYWASLSGKDSLDSSSPAVYNFVTFTSPVTGSPASVSLKLPYLFSGKYDVYLIMVPRMALYTNPAERKITRITATMNFLDETGVEKSEKSTFPTAKEKGYSVTTITGNTEELTTSVNRVDTIPLFKDFKFPTATLGLPVSKINTSLTIATTVKGSEFTANKTVTNALNLARVVLIAKD